MIARLERHAEGVPVVPFSIVPGARRRKLGMNAKSSQRRGAGDCRPPGEQARAHAVVVATVPAMRPRVSLVSRRFVDLRRVASQMCMSRDVLVRMPGCP